MYIYCYIFYIINNNSNTVRTNKKHLLMNNKNYKIIL